MFPWVKPNLKHLFTHPQANSLLKFNLLFSLLVTTWNPSTPSLTHKRIHHSNSMHHSCSKFTEQQLQKSESINNKWAAGWCTGCCVFHTAVDWEQVSSFPTLMSQDWYIHYYYIYAFGSFHAFSAFHTCPWCCECDIAKVNVLLMLLGFSCL